MRSLARPEVLRSAIIAGLCSTLVCWPRIATAPHQRYPVWYLEAVVLSGSIVLWGFVFAWHTQYRQRAVFTLKVAGGPFALAPQRPGIQRSPAAAAGKPGQYLAVWQQGGSGVGGDSHIAGTLVVTGRPGEPFG